MNAARPRIFIIGNPEKPDVMDATQRLRRVAEARFDVAGLSYEPGSRAVVGTKATRVVVLGGDGTLIGVARSLAADQVPLIGVNLGKLGYLTEFSMPELEAVLDRAMTDESLLSRRIILEVTVTRGSAIIHNSVAINDCVVQAGPPFRMVDLGVSLDQADLTELRGDGLIVCTPSGSTAHNLSAGGPIVQSDVHAMILTPLSPHSLTHKPLVIGSESIIEIVAARVNPGTTAIIDGQVSCPLAGGDRVSIRRFASDFQVVRNPKYAKWHNLVTKLHWGQSPGE